MDKAIFVHIPKTAGMSTIDALGLKYFTRWKAARDSFKNEGHVTFRHQLLPKLISDGIVKQDFYDESYIFTFVRNPFDRFVSIYHVDSNWNAKVPFEQYADIIIAQRQTGIRNTLTRPQVDYISDIRVDYIGKFENLEADLKHIGKKLGKTVSYIPHENRGEHRVYTSYYNKELEEKVIELYEDDFYAFNYPLNTTTISATKN